MYNEYAETRTKLMAPILKEVYRNEEFADTRFVYFSLEDMKAYISFLEEIQQQNPDKDVSGVRVYFGAYPNAESVDGKTVKYPGQQSVFMAPTKHIGEVDKTYPTMNNLPFCVKGTTENPLKGDFEIIESLMLDYKKEERLGKANESASQKTSVQEKASVERSELTSTLFNEGQLSPPPL